MKEQEKREMEERRKEAAITNMYFNRYLMVRYAIAVFLFVNIYWAAMLYTAKSAVYLMFAPLLLVVGFAWAMWEMVRMNTREQLPAVVTPRVFQASIVVNIVVALVAIFQHYTLLFPFFQQTQASFLVVLLVQALGLFISFAVLSRLRRINHKADKQYQRIQSYLTAVS